MTDHTKTISNSVNVFGASPTSNWGVMTWTVAKWGEGTLNVVWDLGKLVTDSVTLADQTLKNPNKVLSNSVSVTDDPYEIELFDSAGYNYVFPHPTSNAVGRSDTSWTDTDVGDVATWTCQAVATTTWSEL